MEAMNVAKYIINKCTNDNHPISNLQLQKIMYYIQYEFLVEFDKPLFEDDFQAWKFGPCIPRIYYMYCGAGSLKLEYNYSESNKFFDKKQRDMIDKIVEDKRKKYPWDLVADTHKIGKAWDLAFKDGVGVKSIIKKEDIKYNAF